MHALQANLKYGIPLIVTSEILIVFFYFWLRHRLTGEAFMLARNGQRVLRIMLKAAEKCVDQTRRTRKACNSSGIAKLYRSLPWLPAYERRDIIVIQLVLDRFLINPLVRCSSRASSTKTAEVDLLPAVALSAYFAEVLSGTDPTVQELSLREWFHGSGIDFDSLMGRTRSEFLPFVFTM